MAFIDESGNWIGPGPDPRKLGTTASTPVSFNPNAIPQIAVPQGKTIDEWTNLLNANSGYMGWKLGAAKTADEAAAMRTAALRSLAMQYGGLPQGFQDVYGDLSPTDLQNAAANPLSESANIARNYGQSRDQLMRSLAARGALQSGDLGYGMDRLDTAHAQDLYDLSNAFTDSAQQAVNSYSSQMNQLEEDQMQQIQSAAAAVYGQGYRLTDAQGNPIDTSGWGTATGGHQIGAFEMPFLPQGYSDEAVNNAATAYAQAHGYQGPHMVMNEGTITYQNGQPGIMVKYVDRNGQFTTEWTPIGQPDEAQAAAPAPSGGGGSVVTAPPPPSPGTISQVAAAAPTIASSDAFNKVLSAAPSVRDPNALARVLKSAIAV